MKLTLENKLEIVDYIGEVPRYQETFDEVYDHIVTAHESIEGSEFNMDRVKEIVQTDFGGFGQISADEKEFVKSFVRSCTRDMKQEFIEALKFPMLLFNGYLSVLCAAFYQDSRYFLPCVKVFLTFIYVTILILIVGYFLKRYVHNPTRMPSVKFKFMCTALLICAGCSYSINSIFLSKSPMLEVSSDIKKVIAFAILLALCNFLFAYYKVYQKRLRILV